MSSPDQSRLKGKAADYLSGGWPNISAEERARNEQSRARKARKVATVLEDAGALRRADARLPLVVLDIGCSGGVALAALQPYADVLIGVDLDRRTLASSNVDAHFAIADGEQLPFSDGSIDIAICNHIYEHTDDPQALMDEVWRVLKPGASCYFGGPNRWELVEPHYGLPLLSWLPRPMAHWYMRISGKGSHYLEKPLSLRGVRRLLRRFDLQSMAMRILGDPVHFGVEDLVRPGSVRQRLALLVARWIPGLVPGFIFVCRKRCVDTGQGTSDAAVPSTTAVG